MVDENVQLHIERLERENDRLNHDKFELTEDNEALAWYNEELRTSRDLLTDENSNLIGRIEKMRRELQLALYPEPESDCPPLEWDFLVQETRARTDSLRDVETRAASWWEVAKTNSRVYNALRKEAQRLYNHAEKAERERDAYREGVLASEKRGNEQKARAEKAEQELEVKLQWIEGWRKAIERFQEVAEELEHFKQQAEFWQGVAEDARLAQHHGIPWEAVKRHRNQFLALKKEIEDLLDENERLLAENQEQDERLEAAESVINQLKDELYSRTEERDEWKERAEKAEAELQNRGELNVWPEVQKMHNDVHRALFPEDSEEAVGTLSWHFMISAIQSTGSEIDRLREELYELKSALRTLST